jgi:hypothetical protein
MTLEIISAYPGNYWFNLSINIHSRDTVPLMDGLYFWILCNIVDRNMKYSMQGRYYSYILRLKSQESFRTIRTLKLSYQALKYFIGKLFFCLIKGTTPRNLPPVFLHPAISLVPCYSYVIVYTQVKLYISCHAWSTYVFHSISPPLFNSHLFRYKYKHSKTG